MIGDRINDTSARGAYCGPTAISALTRAPISVIIKKVRRIRSARERKRYPGMKGPLKGGHVLDVNGRKIPVRGIWNDELLKVMRRLGRSAKAEGSGRRDGRKHIIEPTQYKNMTLREFCEDRAHQQDFIVEVKQHYVAVGGGMICDTYTGGKAIPWREYKHLRCRVQRWWKF